MPLNFIKTATILLVVLLLEGCSFWDSPAIRTMSHAFATEQQNVARHFDQNYRFMRLVVDGRVVFLALGDKEQGTEIWYSANHEVLKFSDGRITGASGTFTEWRNVVLPALPAWGALAQLNTPYQWTRKRDVMPGYRYGVSDELSLNKIPAPRQSHLAGIAPEKLIWFQEAETSKDAQLPPAIYAYDPDSQVVTYGETCLASTLCFSWQRWPENLQ